MLPVLERIVGKPFTDETRDFIEILVIEHGLAGDAPPKWMVQLFQDIIERKPQRRKHIPSSSPDGDNVLINLLLTIEDELVWVLGFDDFGEAFQWRIDSCGVEVFIDCTTENSLLNIFPI